MYLIGNRTIELPAFLFVGFVDRLIKQNILQVLISVAIRVIPEMMLGSGSKTLQGRACFGSNAPSLLNVAAKV